ncbi:kinesin heavy chain-like [Pectinophora gossypiella]|uniref:kinesin heavy chain-like n=1 Tax=Pectinophora gossypiella TaxID=13191 RepID=UPI00214E0151|nr:kinesin heavy chain-like [Pectinophora gossypiella]
MSNVKLAIRVRPFTDRELKSEKDRVSVVSVVDGHTVTITNIKVNVSGAGDSRERVRRYTADYTFDSSCCTTDPAYASQKKVFESVGREVMASVSRGSSACVLAYGQSATGKTHTMMGTADQPGLIPRLCRAFAEDVLDVTISFLEIYNERVHDLLAGEPLPGHSLPRRRGNARKDLRVREHPERGPYVQNLRRIAVTDITTLLSLVEEGARRRQTAATRRNSTSSRSHALLELATPRATLHLADLAGSEKASWEGCGGGRQKEGANINKSLVALSNVISALVSGGSRGRFVPYRDSALTWLLKDCFTGGATTFIIATVSPSVACYGESASTLRWAERARQLRTPRLLATGPSTASKAALQAQLNQLLAELERHHILYNLQTGKIAYGDNHWTLHSNAIKVQLSETTSKEATIGNILNMFQPKADAQNSESTASSVASGSSDVINTMDKNLNIKDEISKEVDKLLTPGLERTRSGSDLGIIAPLRHKRRQYKSQETLPIDKSLHVFAQNIAEHSQSQSRDDMRETQETDKPKQPQVPIMYDNQRAEIVASVTERLYSKLKKKEEAAVSKMETMVDKKIVEPLSELRICTNARQRLMEISQRAMRHKRRIGIPAHTQTRRTVTRVRDQGIDVQTDLESYIFRKERSYTVQRDVSTETIPVTPRCKEIAVGPKSGSLDFRDRGTLTETKQVVHRNSFMMTDVVAKCDRCSQTPMPPPRRKKRAAFSKRVLNNEHHICCPEECSAQQPVISINISQQYQVDSESQSSDDNLDRHSSDDNLEDRNLFIKPATVSTTPDLLTNHNNVDTSVHEESESDHMLVREPQSQEGNLMQDTLIYQSPDSNNKEFPEECLEECSLPRVAVASARTINQEEMKDMILGRNENMYPYNIILSPPRERDDSKRIVKFVDDDVAPVISVASQTSLEPTDDDDGNKVNLISEASHSHKECETSNGNKDSETCSDSTDTSKVETDSFIWKRYNRNENLSNKPVGRGYTPVYRNNPKYKAAKTKIYRDFLGLDYNTQFSSLTNDYRLSSSDSTENESAQYKFRQRRQFFEDKFKSVQNPSNRFDILERNILDSCKSLDTSVNKYEKYLANYHDNNRVFVKPVTKTRTPKEYLHHLVQLRREMIRTEYDTTDSSIGICRK